MNDNENENRLEFESEESFDFDALEKNLEKEIEDQLTELYLLEDDLNVLNSPDDLGETVLNVVWDQFINQVGEIAGEDFVKENRGLKLNLSSDAHIQTTENFENGIIATHNTIINYQERYDDWQSNFQKDSQGKVIKTTDRRSGKEKAKLNKDARVPFDKDRPKGSSQIDIDHDISAAEIIRDPAANAHLSKEEQIAFANSEKNLNPMDRAANRSKQDSSMEDWLASERNGQKPSERFNIDEDELRAKDKEAREEYEKQKKAGEDQSIETGKKSKKEEAFRMGGKALRTAVVVLLSELVRKIIVRLIQWIKQEGKNLSSLIAKIKEAVIAFVHDLAAHILVAGRAFATAIATALIGPIVSTINSACLLIKTGGKSVKEAIKYINDPINKDKNLSIVLLEVGKIIVVGLTASGAIVLSELIEKGLASIPGFAFEIPLLGSLANIFGIFFGAVICGIIGAMLLHTINEIISRKKSSDITMEQISKNNIVIEKQYELIDVSKEQLKITKEAVAESIGERHEMAQTELRGALKELPEGTMENGRDKFEIIDKLLDGLSE